MCTKRELIGSTFFEQSEFTLWSTGAWRAFEIKRAHNKFSWAFLQACSQKYMRRRRRGRIADRIHTDAWQKSHPALIGGKASLEGQDARRMGGCLDLARPPANRIILLWRQD